MRLLLARHAETPDSTLGMLYTLERIRPPEACPHCKDHMLDGARLACGPCNARSLVCFTLEDGRREPKVDGETRIPAGAYRVTLRKAGGLHERYAREFGVEFHRGMLWLRSVPGFEWIYLHCGNTVQETAGCILVGSGSSLPGVDGKFRLTASRAAYGNIYPSLADAAARDDLTIRVEDIP